jgi:hypothetical protein
MQSYGLKAWNQNDVDEAMQILKSMAAYDRKEAAEAAKGDRK